MGVFLRSFFSLSIFELLEIILIGVFVFGVSIFINTKNRKHAYFLFFALAFVLGVVRTEFAYRDFLSGQVFVEGEKISGVGEVVDEVDVRDDYSVLHVAVSGRETHIRIKVPQYPEFKYGDIVGFTGVTHFPETFKTDSGRIFNYPGYLMKDGIHYDLRNAEVTYLKKNVGNKIVVWLLKMKHSWLDSVSRLVPEPSASLIGGVVVGAKRSLGDKLLNEFRDVGIIHIVVLSGYNLTLVANSIMQALSILPHSFGFAFGSLGVVSFALMVGGGSTVVRASIMAIIGMFAGFTNRKYVLLRALLISGVFMILWNPFLLVFDSGFQLSFLATAGLIFFSPFFEEKLFWLTSRWGFRGIVSATFATQLSVFPLLMYQVGTVSLVAPIVNVLILPMVPTAMFVSFITGVFGMFNNFFVFPFAFASHALFSYMFFVVDIFAKFPFASLKLPIMPFWFLILLYIILIYVFWKIEKKF